jgi:hypothetical protein
MPSVDGPGWDDVAGPVHCATLGQVTDEQQLREKLRKITALFERATTPGERQAAAAAMERIRAQLPAQAPPPQPESRFTVADEWQRRLLVALCRRHGLKPYRYRGQRRTTIMVRAAVQFVDRVLWPEYVELEAVLRSYLDEVTERIIREEVYGDTAEAGEQG